MAYRMLFSSCIVLACGAVTFAQTPILPQAEPSNSAMENVLADRGPAPAANVWVSGEYLMTWFRGASLPALVTTSPDGTTRTSAGILGTPGTSTLVGGDVNDRIRAGFRLAPAIGLRLSQG